MRPDIVLNQIAASALVRPLRDASEGVIEYGLRLAWVNGLMDARWVVASESRSIGMRYCPQCLCESQWWRSEWRLLNQVICQEHHGWLRSRCHACGKPLRLPQTRFLSCACGADHRDAPIRPLSQAMIACLRLDRPPSAEVLTWFGAWSLHGPRGKPLKKASVTGAEERATLLEAGAEVVMDWPKTWHDSMNRHRCPIDAGKVQRLNDAWSGLSIQIKRLPDAVWRDRIWSAIDTLVAESRTTSRPIVGRNPCLLQRAPTQKATAQALGVGVVRLRTTLVRATSSGQLSALCTLKASDEHDEVALGRTPVRHTLHGRYRHVISPVRVKALAAALSAHVSVRTAAVVLGCGRSRISALVNAGVFQVDRDRLLRSDIEALRDRVLAKARPPGMNALSGFELESLDRIWRMLVPAPFTREFLEAVDAEKIRLSAPADATGWREVSASTADVNAWWLFARTRASEAVSLSEAANILGVKEQVAYELANRGLLQTITLRVGRRLSQRVPPSAIDEFNAKYAALNTLAVAERVHSRAALGWAQLRGLKVVTGPKIDGTRQYFVER